MRKTEKWYSNAKDKRELKASKQVESKEIPVLSSVYNYLVREFYTQNTIVP